MEKYSKYFLITFIGLLILVIIAQDCSNNHYVPDTTIKYKKQLIIKTIDSTNYKIAIHKKKVDSLEKVNKKLKSDIKSLKKKIEGISYVVDTSDINIVNCDSLNKYKDTIIVKQDSTINNQDSVITIQKTIIADKDKIIDSKDNLLGLSDEELKQAKKEIRRQKRKVVFTKIVAGVVIVTTLIILL